jgi:hypothetical protein
MPGTLSANGPAEWRQPFLPVPAPQCAHCYAKLVCGFADR